jgi:hypothetical protein
MSQKRFLGQVHSSSLRDPEQGRIPLPSQSLEGRQLGAGTLCQRVLTVNRST